MRVGYRPAAQALVAWLLFVASQASPAAGQIGSIRTTGEILAGESSSDSSTTIADQGSIFLEPAPTTATMIVGFNVNADAQPGLVAPEIGIASFEMTFALDHAASFNLVFEFFLHGQLLRLRDEECQGAIILPDISIPSLKRLRDGQEFPLNVVLSGAALEIDSTDAVFNLSGQDSRVIEVRGDPVETTAYQLTFSVSATAISQSCEVSARFGADNGLTTFCSACVYPGEGNRVRDEDGLFVTVTVDTLCGNLTLDAGEQCDLGSGNGVEGSCCDRFCRFLPVLPAPAICRPAASDCDRVETCTGQSGLCPEDLKKTMGSACTSDNNDCTDDVCNAVAECIHFVLEGASCQNESFCDGGEFCSPQGQCVTLEPPPCTAGQTCDEENDTCLQVAATPTPTPNGTGTAVPTATATTATPAATPPTATATNATPGAPTSTSTATAGICAGDCNGNGTVVINELILGVNIAAGNRPASACTAFDGNRNDLVAINELIAGVNSALTGCRI